MSGSFSIGSHVWPGLSKLVEELGELSQVSGKLIGTGGIVEHWDGSNLRVRFEEEMADVIAAVLFFATQNGFDLNRIKARAAKKLAQYRVWHKEQG